MGHRYITTGSFETFEKLISKSLVYVDKSGSAAELGNQRGSFLLTRPRRMGKTTLVSTLKYLFTHGTVVTDGLECFDKWKDPYRYFVFHFSFHTYDYSTVDGFKRSFINKLKDYADFFDLSIPHDLDLVAIVEWLLKSAVAQMSNDEFMAKHPELGDGDRPFCPRELVLLIDEYDAPLNDNLDNHEVFAGLIDEYQRLFSALKDLSMRFVFVTGVSSYAHTAIFSEANQFSNVTLDDRFATCCGYTCDEIEHYFAPELEHAQKTLGISHDELMHELEYFYCGYQFFTSNSSEPRLFNPVSISSFLNYPDAGFDGYWSATSSNVTFMYRLMELASVSVNSMLFKSLFEDGSEQALNAYSDHVGIMDFFTLAVNTKDLSQSNPYLLAVPKHALLSRSKQDHELDSLGAIVILFQSGYLSIKGYIGDTLLLGIANHEVAKALADLIYDYSFSNNELSKLAQRYLEINSSYDDLFAVLRNGADGLAQLINQILSDEPWELFSENTYETVVVASIYRFLQFSGCSAYREVTYVPGRADIVVKKQGSLSEDVIFEFKLARQNDNVFDKLHQGCVQLLERDYGSNHGINKPLRYSVVISTVLRQVAAIAKLDEHESAAIEFKSPYLNADGSVMPKEKREELHAAQLNITP